MFDVGFDEMILIAIVAIVVIGRGIDISMVAVLAVPAGLLLQLVGQLNSSPVTLWIWENLKNAIFANVVLAAAVLVP